MCSPDEGRWGDRNVVFLIKIVGINVSCVFFDYLLIYKNKYICVYIGIYIGIYIYIL